MTGQVPGDGKCPVLLREDPQNALKQLSSILTSKDYKDQDSHSIEAMGEKSLFSLAQVYFGLPFLSIVVFVHCF